MSVFSDNIDVIIIPDHSIQKLGLKLQQVVMRNTFGGIPDHSIQKLGLKLRCTRKIQFHHRRFQTIPFRN